LVDVLDEFLPVEIGMVRGIGFRKNGERFSLAGYPVTRGFRREKQEKAMKRKSQKSVLASPGGWIPPVIVAGVGYRML